jgi:hypothetical protein
MSALTLATKAAAAATSKFDAEAAVATWDPAGAPLPASTILALRLSSEQRSAARDAGLGPDCLPCADCHHRELKHWRQCYFFKTGDGTAIPPRHLQLRELTRRNKPKAASGGKGKGKGRKAKSASATFGKGDMPDTPAGRMAAAEMLKEFASAVLVDE